MKPRLLISLILDNSASLQGNRFDKFKAALDGFMKKFEEIPDKNIELEIIAFNEFSPIVLKTFKDETFDVNKFESFKMPFLGKAISLALNDLKEREDFFDEKGVDIYKSWLFIINDAYNFDELDDALLMLQNRLESGSLLYMPFMLSQKKITSNIEPLYRTKRFMRIKENAYEVFFDWFIMMAQKRAQAPIGTAVKFDRAGFEGWAIL